MEAIANVESKNKEWIQKFTSEMQRENASNFVSLERCIRLKLEALELRLTSTIEELRNELVSQISTFKSNMNQRKSLCDLFLFDLILLQLKG